MQWNSEAITPGEIDALRLAAAQAWADDTRYPRWAKDSSVGGGQCYVTAVWLKERLGGYVGKKNGHFAWLSPDHSYILDVTGNHSGVPTYTDNDGYKPYKVVSNKRAATFSKRANLIFNNLEGALRVSADSLTGDAYPGEGPEVQTLQSPSYWHDEPALDEADKNLQEYNFFYANGSLEISPADIFNHDDLARHLNINNDHKGPMASGAVTVVDNKATWDAYSNVDLKTLSRVFKDYSDQVGWKWGGIKDVHGKVVSSTLEPPKRATVLNYAWANNHLYIGKTSHAVLALEADDSPLCGTIEIVGKKARITPAYTVALPQLFEWANDQGIKLYGSSNNLVERNETMEIKDLGVPDDNRPPANPVEGEAEDDTTIDSETELGVHKCPICDEIFPDWHLYNEHRRDEHGESDAEIGEEDGGFPELDMDVTNPPHFTEQQPTTMPVTAKSEAARVDGPFDKYARAFEYDESKDRFYVAYLHGSPVGYGVVRDTELRMIYSAVKKQGVFSALENQIKKHYPRLETYMAHDWEPEVFRKRGWVNVDGKKWVYQAASEPKDVITDPIPFIYDIPADTVTVGHPGQRTSDIPGKFTPAGIVEGMYEPGGTVNITTMTTMPYTVNHILTLWYYQYPEFSVKRVNLIDAEGKKTKLANGAL
jgi:hypothetical protein